jgi:predicted secreted hydrolase
MNLRAIGNLGLALVVVLFGGCDPRTPRPPAADLSVLAQGAEGFAEAQPGAILEFPRDHGAHPDFRIEWWYLTANLEDDAGRPYGAQWTLFRFAARRSAEDPPEANAWQTGQVFMAHFALTTPDDHVSFQRYARGGDHAGLAQAGATAVPFAAWLDDWSLASMGDDWLPLELAVTQDSYGLHLELDSSQPLVLQGDGGFSKKHPDGGGSYYYSQPFLTARGLLRFAGKDIPVTGLAWLDREWSSQFLQREQAGWDWLALHLDSGEKLMLFQLRARDGSPPFRHGVLLDPQGNKLVLDSTAIGLQPLEETVIAGRRLPLEWGIELPQIGRSIRVRALHPRQWMDVDFPYWEGAVTADGSDAGSRGKGYLEMTGYVVD